MTKPIAPMMYNQATRIERNAFLRAYRAWLENATQSNWAKCWIAEAHLKFSIISFHSKPQDSIRAFNYCKSELIQLAECQLTKRQEAAL